METPRDQLNITTGVVAEKVVKLGSGFLVSYRVANHIYDRGRTTSTPRGEVLFAGQVPIGEDEYTAIVRVADKGEPGQVRNGFPFEGDIVDVGVDRMPEDSLAFERWVASHLDYMS